MPLLTDILKPLVRERALIGLTGGTATDLDGIVTLGVDLSPVPYALFVVSGTSYLYFLRAGTDAESSPSIIRPDDYSGGTNEKVWERISFGGGGGSGDMLAANNLSDVDDVPTSRQNLGLEIGADVQAWSANLDAWSALATSAKQNALGFTPLNAASNLSDLANAGTARTNLGLVIGTNVQAWDAELDLWAAINPSAKQNALGYTPLNPANNLSDLTSFSTARTNLSLVIGTDVQAWSANLDAWSALATSAKQNALGFTPLNVANNLSDLANVSTARTNLSLVVGTDVEAWSANLDAWSALATSAKLTTSSNLSDVPSPSTARTNLGLAIGSNVQAWSANLDSWSALATSAKLTTASNLSDLANAGTARTNLGLVIGTNVQAWSANLDSWSAIATSTKLTAASNLSDLANAATARTNLGVTAMGGVNAQTGTSYTIVSGDQGKLITFSNTAATAVTLPQAAGAFANPFLINVVNLNTGVVTITPTTSTIDGAATLILLAGQSALIYSDGTNYKTNMMLPGINYGEVANTAVIRNPASNGSVQSLFIYGTTDASVTNYERMELIQGVGTTPRISIAKGGTGSQRDFAISFNGTTRVYFPAAGGMTLGSGGKLGFYSSSIPQSTPDACWIREAAGAMSASTTGAAIRTGTISSITGLTPGVQFVATADATVANTTSETSILGTGVGSLTIPAAALNVAGKMLRVTVRGIISNTATPTLNIKFKVGGSTIVSTGAQTISAVVSNSSFEVVVLMTVRTTGSSGTVLANGDFEFDSTTFVNTREPLIQTGTSTVNLTGTLAVDVSATWGTASASNTITGQEVLVEMLG